MGCFPIVLGGGVQVATAPTATIGGSASIDASLTAQLGPAALSLSAASVTTGATLAWTVYGPLDTDETAQIITAGSTSATPTWAAFTAASGKVAGLWVVKCVVTKDASSTTYTRRVRVGDTDGRVQTHNVDWTAAANAGTHTGAAVARDGLTYTFGSGSSSSAVATEGVGLVLDDGAAGSIACDWAGSDSGAGTITQADDVVFYVAYDGGISGSDTVTLSWLNATGVERFAAEASYYTSAHHVSCKLRRASTYTFTFKATTSASRVMALRIIKGVLSEVRYSTTAHSGTWPVFSAMTKVFATRTSNVVTAQDLNSTDAADKIDPSTSIGRLAVSGANRTIAATAIFTRSIG